MELYIPFLGSYTMKRILGRNPENKFSPPWIRWNYWKEKDNENQRDKLRIISPSNPIRFIIACRFCFQFWLKIQKVGSFVHGLLFFKRSLGMCFFFSLYMSREPGHFALYPNENLTVRKLRQGKSKKNGAKRVINSGKLHTSRSNNE